MNVYGMSEDWIRLERKVTPGAPGHGLHNHAVARVDSRGLKDGGNHGRTSRIPSFCAKEVDSMLRAGVSPKRAWNSLRRSHKPPLGSGTKPMHSTHLTCMVADPEHPDYHTRVQEFCALPSRRALKNRARSLQRMGKKASKTKKKSYIDDTTSDEDAFGPEEESSADDSDGSGPSATGMDGADLMQFVQQHSLAMYLQRRDSGLPPLAAQQTPDLVAFGHDLITIPEACSPDTITFTNERLIVGNICEVVKSCCREKCSDPTLGCWDRRKEGIVMHTDSTYKVTLTHY